MRTRGADTRLRLLDAAVSVIGSSGWGAASSRAVAEAAGVNSALVHYHFGSIDQLRREALAHAMQTEAGRAMEAMLEAPDVLSGAVEAMRLLTEHAGEISDGERVIVEGMVQAMRDDVLREEFRTWLVELRELMTAGLVDDQAKGLVEPDVDPAHLAGAVAALIDGLMLHIYVQSDFDAAGAMAAVAELAREGTGSAQRAPARRGAQKSTKKTTRTTRKTPTGADRRRSTTGGPGRGQEQGSGGS
jgi:AcrR family transcriptional regulator